MFVSYYQMCCCIIPLTTWNNAMQREQKGRQTVWTEWSQGGTHSKCPSKFAIRLRRERVSQCKRSGEKRYHLLSAWCGSLCTEVRAILTPILAKWLPHWTYNTPLPGVVHAVQSLLCLPGETDEDKKNTSHWKTYIIRHIIYVHTSWFDSSTPYYINPVENIMIYQIEANRG